MSDLAADRESELKLELLMLNIQMRRKQVFWETPKGLLLVAATAAGLAGAVFGWLGYQAGRMPEPTPAPIIIQVPAK